MMHTYGDALMMLASFFTPVWSVLHAYLPFGVWVLTLWLFLVLAKQLSVLSDSALKNGVHICAGPGSGKSRLMGRMIAWQQLLRRKPQLILDPTGGVVDNLLDKLVRLPLAYRRVLWPRLRYLGAGAGAFITKAPLYYRISPTDTLFEIANRFPALLKRLDPELQSAPILGWNPLFECAIFAGQIAAALGRQLDFVADLITNPRNYKEELKAALAAYPELKPAVDYFRALMDPNSGELRSRHTASFRNKLLLFLADPTMLATFSAPARAVDWEQVVRQGQTVLIDFRHEHDPDRRRFKLLYWFRDFVEYIKYRGMAGRGQEVTFMIDEVTQMLGYRTLNGQSILAEDLEELISVLARNYAVNSIVSHQNLSQVDERINNVLMQMGTQIIGVTPNPDDALYLARQLVPFDPYQVKKWERVWMGLSGLTPFGRSTEPTVIDYRSVEFTPDEFQLLAAQRFQQLGRFRFLVRPAAAEGQIAGRLYPVNIARFDAGQYPQEAILAPLRRLLAERDGTSLSELEQERSVCLPPPQVKSEPPSDTLIPTDQNAYATTPDSLSGTSAPAEPAPAATGYRGRWQKTESP